MAEFIKQEVSYSQYSLWSTCPLQWKLRYIDGLKSDSGIELVFGTAMHETIQHWLKLLYGDSPIKAKTFDMEEMLKERLMELVKKELLKDGKTLTTKEQVAEYYADGCNILDHVRKYAKDWFPKNYQLLGVEVPLEAELFPGLIFKGFIDVVLYHKASKMLYIYDFKTSRFGWTYQKKDPKKFDQLLLYKKFYSKLFGIPESNIKIEFIILKRKVSENTEFQVKHVVGFEPANGAPSIKKAEERFNRFVAEVFDDDNNIRLDNIKATPSESNCKYCMFKNDETKCSASFYLPNNKRKITKK